VEEYYTDAASGDGRVLVEVEKIVELNLIYHLLCFLEE
jgi:hypothetical protein